MILNDDTVFWEPSDDTLLQSKLFLYDNKEEHIIYTYILSKVHILIWIFQFNISFWNNFTIRKNFKNSTKFPAFLHINKYQMHSTMSKSKKLTENNWLIYRPYWNFNNCLIHVLFLDHELIFSYPVFLVSFHLGEFPFLFVLHDPDTFKETCSVSLLYVHWFTIVWYFLILQFTLCILGKKITKMICCTFLSESH